MGTNWKEEIRKTEQKKAIAQSKIEKYSKISKKLRMIAFYIYPFTSALNLIGALAQLPFMIYISLCVSFANTFGNFSIIRKLERKTSENEQIVKSCNSLIESYNKALEEERKIAQANQSQTKLIPTVEIRFNNTNKNNTTRNTPPKKNSMISRKK